MHLPVLAVIPRNRFEEEELFPLREGLEKAGRPLVVLSPSGKEATGRQRKKFMPDGMLVDWNRQPGVRGKYPAVVVLGGKGAPKSLWTDEVLPQLLTDHYRAGSWIGGVGLGVAVLARAGLLEGEASAPEDPDLLEVLEQAGVARSPDPITRSGRVVSAQGAEAMASLLTDLLNHLAGSAVS